MTDDPFANDPVIKRFREIKEGLRKLGIPYPESHDDICVCDTCIEGGMKRLQATTPSPHAGVLEALKNYDDAMIALGTCGDGNCVILRPKGQHTNGGCHCYRDEKRARRAMACASFLRARIVMAIAATERQPEQVDTDHD